MKQPSKVCAVLMTASLLGCSSRIDPAHHDRAFDAGGILIDQTTQIRHTFKVENDSDSPLNIKEISKSCTCASATISKRRLAPGETADLEMVVNVRPIFNRWNVACRVLTDHPTEPVM
jgi:hypothetical protein